MKKLLIISAAAMCLVFAGCNTTRTPQTGRSVTINQTIYDCTIYANARLTDGQGAEQALADALGASGDVLSPKGAVWSTSESEGGQTATVTPTLDIPVTTTFTYGGAGVPIADAAKSLAKLFTGADGKIDVDALKNALLSHGYEKKAVDDFVNGMCGIP